MQTFPGYHGNYLRVDLSTATSEVRRIPQHVARQFIGGGGLGTWLLLQETPVGEPLNPLGTAAPLLFVFSPLVGTPLTTSAKFAVLAKSPLTHRINDSLSSSHFAIAGKKTGHDAIVIVGQAEEPVCLVIEPESVCLRPVGELWGLSSEITARRVKEQLGNHYQVAAIGPAGERQVAYATISNDGRHAGRGGLGAVMGSKKLKAVAVTGQRLPAVADPQGLIAYSKQLSALSFGAATAKYRELGTISNLLTFNRLGTLPTRNFQSGVFAEAEALSPEVLEQGHARTRTSCAACTIGCEHIFQTQKGTGVRLEYENLFALGPLCGVSNSDIVLQASRYCDDVGMDTISAGVCIAFAMECAERGLIADSTLTFGRGDALLATLEKIVSGEGIGAILAQGVRAAAAEIGQGSAEFALHVKGLELPGYDPRALQTMALGFAVGTRGADHNRSGAYQVDFSEQVDRLAPDVATSVLGAIETEDEAAVMDSLILCKFLRGVFEDRFSAMAQMLNLVTGWDCTATELRETAQRIVTAKKTYNVQQGWTPAEDRLPGRFFSTPLPEGTTAGAVLDPKRLQAQIQAYNLARGWNAEGYPVGL